MNAWDRWFRRTRAEVAEKPRDKFCFHCGAMMVAGYLVHRVVFDPETGRPVTLVRRGWLCSSQSHLGDGCINRLQSSARYEHEGVWRTMHAPIVAIWTSDVS